MLQTSTFLDTVFFFDCLNVYTRKTSQYYRILLGHTLDTSWCIALSLKKNKFSPKFNLNGLHHNFCKLLLHKYVQTENIYSFY